jgi:hypothetical protein
MSDHNSEAVLVAVATIVLWLISGGFDVPKRFSIRGLFAWTTIVAIVLGAIAVLARIEH